MIEAVHGPTVRITRYRIRISKEFRAHVALDLAGPDGVVEIRSDIDARDVRGRLTRTISMSGQCGSTTIPESELPDWQPHDNRVHSDAQSLKVAINDRYIARATDWYQIAHWVRPHVDTSVDLSEVIE